MNKSVFTAAMSAITLTAAFASVNAAADGGRMHRQNAVGGFTGGAAHGGTGPNGGRAAASRGIVTDGAGNAAGGSMAAMQGPNGGRAARAGKTTRTADGTVNHASGVSAAGAAGSIDSRGSATKNADGTITQSRDTNASASSGAAYSGNTSYNSASGVSHSGTCTNAAGAVVACR